MNQLVIVGASTLTFVVVFGVALWLGFRAARKQGEAEADRTQLTKDIDRATDANRARTEVDGLSDAAVAAELRRDHTRR